MKHTKKAANALLRKPGRFLYVTHGGKSIYAINGAGIVPRKIAAQLTLPMGHVPDPDILVPNEDGLFPGMSQTWRAAS